MIPPKRVRRVPTRSRRFQAAILVLGVAALGSSEVEAQPTYASPETRSTVKRMLKAHGGIKRWHAAPTISFRRKAILSTDPERPWILDETIEQGRRRLYQIWPEDQAVLASDGREVWTVNWSLLFPPRFVAQIGFYFLNLPWLTQDSGVRLEQTGHGSHPASDERYVTVSMTFEPGTGDTPDDRYTLFIDPKSHLLMAVEYHVSYGALLDAAFLPPQVRSIGPFYHVNEAFETVDGLKVPTRYSVYDAGGNRSISGEVGSWSFSEPFDETHMTRPAEAVTDNSSPTRRVPAR